MANPKSVSLTLWSLSNRIFSGLISLNRRDAILVKFRIAICKWLKKYYSVTCMILTVCNKRYKSIKNIQIISNIHYTIIQINVSLIIAKHLLNIDIPQNLIAKKPVIFLTSLERHIT